VESFLSREVCELAGITYRMLDHWTRTGRVNAHDARTGRPRCPNTPAWAGGGTGHPRTYSQSETAVVVTAAALIRAGFTPDTALNHARTLNTVGVRELADGLITLRAAGRQPA
jgi:hypothetical protein